MRHTSTFTRHTLSAALAVVAALIVACKADSLLTSDNPDVIDPGSLSTAQGAVALYNGAIGDLALALDGGSVPAGLGPVGAGAWFTDEARFCGTPPGVKQKDLRAGPGEAAAG